MSDLDERFDVIQSLARVAHGDPNGTLALVGALCEIARQLERIAEQLTRIADNSPQPPPNHPPKPDYIDKGTEAQPDLNLDIAYLDISTRACNALKWHRPPIETLGQLLEYSEAELLFTENLGKVSLESIRRGLAQHGLTIGCRHRNKGAA